MTQQNKGTPNAPGSNDRTRDASVQPSRNDENPKGTGDTSKRATQRSPNGSPASAASGSDRSSSSAPTSAPTRQGGRPETHKSGECCDPKNAPSTERDRSDVQPQKLGPANLDPTSTKGSIDNLPTPTMSQGIRQIKGDENRASQDQSSSQSSNRSDESRNVAGRGSSRSSVRRPSEEMRDDERHVPGNAESQPGGKEMTRPRDPNEFGRTDPIQPQRAAPTQPSRVVQPSIGMSDTTGESETK